MTGYGKTEVNLEDSNFIIEVKSLNSKQIDINVKMSSIFRSKEMDLRKLLSEKLKRGKIELSIWREKSESCSNYVLNNNAIKNYHQQILSLKKDLGLTSDISLKETDIIPTLLKLPESLIKEDQKSDENEWEKIIKAVNTAISNCLKFRLQEGKKLAKDIKNRSNNISALLMELAPFAKIRIEKVKKSLLDKMSELKSKNIDENRFEQEIIYYLEKQDITEEQVRLSAHLDYFLETMESNSPNGKKLVFITQEIGREINTIGAKSSDAVMQKLVVQMKDEVEKIKEQLLNIL